LDSLRLKNVDIFYVRLEYFMDVWDILLPFGTFCVHFGTFFQFWYHAPRKIWQPCQPAIVSMPFHPTGYSLKRGTGSHSPYQKKE
jgi:hypothetical protein